MHGSRNPEPETAARAGRTSSGSVEAGGSSGSSTGATEIDSDEELARGEARAPSSQHRMSSDDELPVSGPKRRPKSARSRVVP